MNKIPFALGSAAQVAVLAPNADATYANAAGGMSVFAGLVLAKRGKPLSVLHLTKETYLDVLGAAIQPHEGFAFEPIRHVTQALNGGNGYVVRVVPKQTMRIPLLKLVRSSTGGATGSASIDASNSTLSLSPSQLRADGVSMTTIQFTARDSSNNVITNLRNGIGFTATPSSGITLGAISEVANGVYAATMTGTNSGSVIIGVTGVNNQPISGVSASVYFEPAIINFALSEFVATKDSISADLKDSTILTLHARDNNNRPITGIENSLDFNVQGITQTNVTQITTGAPGVYSAVMTGRNAGTAVVSVFQNNVKTQLSKQIELKSVQTVVSRTPDPLNSKLETSSDTSIADNITDTQIVLTVKDGNKQPITKAAGSLHLVITGLTQDYTVTSLVETSVPGEYVATIRSAQVGAAIITAFFQNQLLSGANMTKTIMYGAPSNLVPDANRSLIALTPDKIVGNGSAVSTLTFTALSQGSLPISNLTNVEFHVGNQVFAATNMNDGRYTASYSALNQTGNDQTMDVRVWYSNVEFIGVTAKLLVTVPAVIATADAKLSVLKHAGGVVSIPATGNGTTTITLELRDDKGTLIPDMENSIQFFTTGSSTVSYPTQTSSGSGIYTATVTNAVEENVDITVIFGTQSLTGLTLTIPFVKDDKVISPTLSQLSATAAVAADSAAEVTVTLVAKNSAGAAISGLTLEIADKATTTLTPFLHIGNVTEDASTPGTYTAKVKSDVQGKFDLVIKHSGAVIPGIQTAVEFTADLTNFDETTSDFDIDESYPLVGETMTATLYAHDRFGQALSGLAGLTVVDTKAKGSVTIAPVVDHGNGLYTFAVTAAKGGEFSLSLQANGTDAGMAELSGEVYQPQTLDTTESKIVFGPASAPITGGVEADGTTDVPFAITLMGDDKNAYKPSGKIDLTVSDHSGLTLPGLTADATIPGKFTGIFHSTKAGKITFTVTEGGVATAITGDFTFDVKAGTTPVTPNVGAAPDDSKTTISADKTTAKDDGKDTITLTLVLKKGNSQAADGLAGDLGMKGGKANITITPWTESSTPGTYTATVKGTVDGSLDLIPTYQSTTELTKGKITVEFKSDPVYSSTNSTLGISTAKIQADGTSEAVLTFTAKDQYNQPFTTAVVNFEADKANEVTIDTVAQATGTGVYTAKVKGTANHFSNVKISAKVDGTDSGKTAVGLIADVTVSDNQSHLLNALGGGDLAVLEGQDTTLTFKLADASNTPLSGLADDLEVTLTNGNKAEAVTEVSAGTYSAVLHMTNAGDTHQTIMRKSNSVEVLRTGFPYKVIGKLGTGSTLTKATGLSGNVVVNDPDLTAVARLTLVPNDSSVKYTAAQIKGIEASKPTAKKGVTFTVEKDTTGGDNDFIISTRGTVNGSYILGVSLAGTDIAGLSVPFSVADTADEIDDGSAGGPASRLASFTSNTQALQSRAATPSNRASVANSVRVEATTISVGDDVHLGNDDIMAIYVDDGDASGDRTLSITPHPDEMDTWILTLNQVSNSGDVKVLERSNFTLFPDAIDDMGLPSYLPVMLQNSDSRLRAVVKQDAEFPIAYNGFTDEFFIGGSDGDLSKLQTSDYIDALKVLASSMVNYTAVLSMGCYDSIVLQALAQHSLDVRVDMFCDIKPGVSGTQAISEAQAQGLGSFSHVARYHFPYSSRDPLTRAQVVYGLSGDAFTAKAKGVAMKPDIGGWHFAPAGFTRAVLARSNVTPLPGAASVDREAYVTARINPVTVASDGSVVIDDSLTTWPKNNYLRFQHVNSILNAIARGTYDVCQQMKHEPDGVTREGLEKEIPRFLEKFVASDALVKPRDESQGSEPFVVVVKQVEFDMWDIKIFVCPTGVARRIAVEPILFR